MAPAQAISGEGLQGKGQRTAAGRSGRETVLIRGWKVPLKRLFGGGKTGGIFGEVFFLLYFCGVCLELRMLGDV